MNGTGSDEDEPQHTPDDHPGADAATRLDGLMAELDGHAGTRETIPLGELAQTIGLRGFGPLLALAAGLLILPVGMLPGVPAVVSAVLAAVAVEMLLGRHALRLPRRLREVEVRSSFIQGFVRRARPLTRHLRRIIRPRLTGFATAGITRWLIATLLIATAVVIMVVGFIPGLPFLMALHVLLIGLGMTARDGVAILAGFALVLPSVLVILRVI